MTSPDSAGLRLSVLIPIWNDQEALASALPEIAGLPGLHEVIVADASSGPGAASVVEATGSVYLRAPAPSRGAQMNLAASKATGDVFIFHHVDSALTAAHLSAITAALRDDRVIGGAFYRKFDARHPRLLFLEKAARFLTRNGGSFFGDQSLFVRREIFQSLGGFAPIPLMEDMEFSRRLRRAGRVVVLDPPIATSGRRHLDRGAWRTSIQNGLFIFLYHCGLSPARLHRWYYRDRFPSPNEALFVPEPGEELGGR